MKPNIYTLKGGSLEMTVTDFGARVLTLMVPDRNGNKADVAVGYASLDEYLECPGERFFGAAVGRMANRIGGASFELDGKQYKLPANDNENTLHGGNLGFDRVIWTVKEVQPDSVLFQLRDPDGQEGWPGNLDVEMRYTLTEDNSFKVTIETVGVVIITFSLTSVDNVVAAVPIQIFAISPTASFSTSSNAPEAGLPACSSPPPFNRASISSWDNIPSILTFPPL